MRLPRPLVDALARFLISIFEKLPRHEFGDIVDKASGQVYMRRRWLVKPRWYTFGCGIRIHHTKRSDLDRHLHDHPWPTISLLLKGVYYELVPINGWEGEPVWLPNGTEQIQSWRRNPGDIVRRPATARHRLLVPDPDAGVWSMFLMGPRHARADSWGFYTPEGFVYYKDYLGLNKGATE